MGVDKNSFQDNKPPKITQHLCKTLTLLLVKESGWWWLTSNDDLYTVMGTKKSTLMSAARFVLLEVRTFTIFFPLLSLRESFPICCLWDGKNQCLRDKSFQGGGWTGITILAGAFLLGRSEIPRDFVWGVRGLGSVPLCRSQAQRRR